MPNILVCALKTAEANGDPEQALSSPHGAGCDGGLPELQGLGGVNQHLDRLLHAGLQQVLQGVVILVLDPLGIEKEAL